MQARRRKEQYTQKIKNLEVPKDGTQECVKSYDLFFPKHRIHMYNYGDFSSQEKVLEDSELSSDRPLIREENLNVNPIFKVRYKKEQFR